jgi:sterol desaturase/sphingolipid hydroxylase (fatty acid hydroxylase superfamily)
MASGHRPSLLQMLLVWFVENGMILFFSFCGMYFETTTPLDVPFWELNIRTQISGFFAVDIFILTQPLLLLLFPTGHIYNESKRSKFPSCWNHWREFFTVLYPAKFIGAFAFTLWVVYGREREEFILRNQPLNLLFIPRFLCIRIISDFVFYIAHYCLHTRYLYAYIHKKHHEDVYTDLSSNVHFSVTDLLIEGFTPSFVAFMVFSVLYNTTGIHFFLLSLKDTRLASGYIQWYQIGSHIGQDVPFVTFFPPLSPIYQIFFPKIDTDNILHHETHHNQVKCNYGITQWMDKLCGTYSLNRNA